MAILHYVSHPQVRVDPDVPVPRWGLSEVGRGRLAGFVERPWLAGVGRLVSSGETKALETAAAAAVATGLAVEVRAELHENDRSATGFQPPDRFEVLADRFFAEPDRSVSGWERAADAQRRVVAGTADLVADAAATGAADVLVVGHGAVGTLLMCHLAGWEIDRRHDQTGSHAAPGGGNHWAFDTVAGTLLHAWRPFDR